MFSNPSIKNNSLFDVIVIGVGSMGSSTCYFLAKQGYKVLGLEQFNSPHQQGSHAGQSRIIRKAYFEHPKYVPLLNSAYENWKDLEEETGTQLYYRTGLVYFGDPSNEMMKGIRQSVSLHNIPLESFDSSSAAKRFPQFKIPANFEAVFEPDAGFITPEKAISLYKEQAVKKGARIHANEKVIEWKKDKDDMVVVTDKNSYRCSKIVITTGAWASKLIPGIADKLKVTRQFVAWIKPKNEIDFGLDNFPCWMIADDERPGAFYGFPVFPPSIFNEPHGLKIAHHNAGEITDPDTVNREVMPQDMEDIKNVLNKYMPGASGSLVAGKTCLYTNTPDENFVIDKLPGFENRVVIACGFSGHGFKFVSVVGQILADLVIEGATKQPIGFLGIKRFEKHGH